MGRAALVLVVLFALAVRQTGAVLDLSHWKPLCHGDHSVDLPDDPMFTNFTVTVTDPKNNGQCQHTKDSTSKTVTLPKGCFTGPKVEVTVQFQEKHISSTLKGGLNYTEAYISCAVDDKGKVQNISTAEVTVHEVTTKIPVTPEIADITLALVAGSATSSTPETAVYLGQDNVFLQVKHKFVSGADHYVLAPKFCVGIDTSTPGTTYTFFSASDTTCDYDSDVMGAFAVNDPTVTPNSDDITFAQFYPFKFTLGNKVTLTCEILICPTTQSPGSTCETVVNKLKTACSAQSPLTTSTAAPTVPPVSTPAKVSSKRRRRRAARGQETHTRVLEVTYSVLDPGPILQGPTAGGAGAAISVPLLAAVASFWIL